MTIRITGLNEIAIRCPRCGSDLNPLAIPPTVCLHCGAIVPAPMKRKPPTVKGLKAETVKKLLNQGLTKSEIARKLNVDPSAISYWYKKIKRTRNST